MKFPLHALIKLSLSFHSVSLHTNQCSFAEGFGVPEMKRHGHSYLATIPKVGSEIINQADVVATQAFRSEQTVRYAGRRIFSRR
eukprot:scaffold5234_cov131-Cylindrotheca_fusiformis.AAC.7